MLTVVYSEPLFGIFSLVENVSRMRNRECRICLRAIVPINSLDRKRSRLSIILMTDVSRKNVLIGIRKFCFIRECDRVSGVPSKFAGDH